MSLRLLLLSPQRPDHAQQAQSFAMCAHFEGVVDPTRIRQHFNADARPSPLEPVSGHALSPKVDLWPGYAGLFIRTPSEAGCGDEAVPEREAIPGIFGLVPNWANDLKLARNTYNARSETVASKPSFRDAWRQARHCIIPADAIYEPDWRSGKATPTRIARADGRPMGIAGLWEHWKQADGTVVHSFTMLTINAQTHELMNRFHQPTDEKRMVVILPEGAYADWLAAPMQESMDFMHAYPAERLVAVETPPALTRASKPPRTARPSPVDDAQGSLL
jgi:putative SOS response-associated peptidase YedK